MKISKRSNKGWQEVENKSDVVCDTCKDKLSYSFAKPYCNNCKIEDEKVTIKKIHDINLKEFEGEQYIKIRTLNRLIQRYISEGKDLMDLQARIVVELI